ncbi:MAG: hypothetical protein LBK98_03395 [Peptococcaceae bacterium]|jgi:putative MATE family efflux protein|nr:hypothetical protein [Peptococcaceae bacterium]
MRGNLTYIKKAFWLFAITAVLSSSGNALGAFVEAVILGGAFGAGGLIALNLAMPVYMLYNLLATTISTGGGILIAVSFGQNDRRQGQAYFTQAMALALVCGLVILAAGLLFMEDLFLWLGAGGVGDATLSEAQDYMRIIILSAPLFVTGQTLCGLIRYDAGPALATVAMAVFTVANIVLDLVFIYGLGWGVPGAAAAIACAEVALLLISWGHFLKKERMLAFVPPPFPPAGLGRILRGGFGVGSAFLFQGAVIFAFNRLLADWHGSLAVAVYGVFFNTTFFAAAYFDGCGAAISPLIGVYYGERNRFDLTETLKLAARLVFCSGLIIGALFVLFSGPIARIFGIEASLLAEAAQTLRIYGFCVLGVGCNTVFIAYAQAVGRERLAFLVSLLRGVGLLLPLGCLLTIRLGALGIAWAYLVTEAVTLVGAVLALLYITRRERLDNFCLLGKSAIVPAGQAYTALIDSGLTGLADLAAEIEGFCENNDISADKVYFINLVIEELAAKIFEDDGQKRRPGRRASYVMIRIIKNGDEAEIHLRYDMAGRNPFREQKATEDELNLLGVKIVQGKAKRFDFQRKLAFNNLYIVL